MREPGLVGQGVEDLVLVVEDTSVALGVLEMGMKVVVAVVMEESRAMVEAAAEACRVLTLGAVEADCKELELVPEDCMAIELERVPTGLLRRQGAGTCRS